MSKFSIIATIDLNKIDDEINKYVKCNGNFDPYIFMSEDTARAIEYEVGAKDFPSERDTKSGGMYATYSGYKVFVNNDLRFGIVEIR